MKLLDALLPSREISRYVPPAWMHPFLQYATPTTTYGVDKAEPIADTFAGYVLGGLQGNGVVWSIERFRMSVFSEARFQFQHFVKGRPADLWGNNDDLQLLENPWVGGTTGDLLTQMILDADMAGNYFAVEMDGEVVRLRPDWVEVVFTERWNDEGRQVGWRKLGYLYYEDGKGGGKEPAVFLPPEVVHFAPYPDPLARWRGMSWLTPVVREVLADTAATAHKLKFFENGATVNLAVSLPKEISADDFNRFVDKMDARHKGVDNAYQTLYTGGGADVTVVGANMQQIDFKVTQGAGETRLAAAGGLHPAVVPLSEGMQGSSLNAGNLGAARRIIGEATLRPLWRNAAGSMEILAPSPSGSRLWYDARDVAFLREDAKDEADITRVDAESIARLVSSGFTQASARAAVVGRNMDLLVEIPGWVSVQMQPSQSAPTRPALPVGQTANGKTPALAGG